MPTNLPSFRFTKDIWNMGRVQLIQLLMYFWGLYQALCGNYQALQAENSQLRQRLAEADESATDSQEERERFDALQAENYQLRQRLAEADESAAESQEEQERFEDLVRRSVNEYEEKLEDLRNQLAALEAENESLKNDAADAAEAKEYLVELESYATRLERELKAMRAKEEAEAAVLHELANDGRWKSVSKGNFVKMQTNAVLNARRETAKLQAEIDNLKRYLIEPLVKSLPFDTVQQELVQEPVIVVPSLRDIDAKILNWKSVRSLQIHGNKFPIGHNATIAGVYECADVKNMFAAILEVLKRCDHNLNLGE